MSKLAVLWIFSAIFLVIITAATYLATINRASIFSLPSNSIATPFALLPEVTQESKAIELLFTGDVMLDRNIRLKAEQNGYSFLIGPKLRELLQSADEVIINLEGPITNNPSVSVGSAVGSTRNFIFTFSPASTNFLIDSSISIVNLGNNHILNFGSEGLSQTYNYLDAAGINYFGFTGQDQPEEKFTYILERDSYRIGFANYNQFISGGNAQVLQDIALLDSQVDYLVVYTHWGNEYVPENETLKNLAHSFVDAGADLVIGSHPHVITGNEVYKNKVIYYSLGNFIFDQYFEPAVKKGLVIKAVINIDTDETTISEYPVLMDGSGQTELITDTNP